MRGGSLRRPAALFLMAVLAAGCGRGEADRLVPPPGETGSGATGPYVISAIDYHFHDAHPTPPLGPGRILVVSNQGSNIHNVTLRAAGVDLEVKPGERLAVGRIGALFPGPGRYVLLCRYHADRGMSGVIIVRR